jgi:hypothetical protein
MNMTFLHQRYYYVLLYSKTGICIQTQIGAVYHLISVLYVEGVVLFMAEDTEVLDASLL